MDWTHWWPLHEDTTGDILLAVDFPTTRTTGSFADLVTSLPGSPPAYLTLLPEPTPTLTEAQPRHYLDGWLADLSRHRPRVRAVMSYCAAAPFALAIADGVEELGLGQPARIFVEPQTVTVGTIPVVFADAAAGLIEAVESAEIDTEIADLTAAASRPDASLVRLAELARDRYERLAHRCADRMGLGGALGHELGARFADYLSYLLASSRLSPARFDASWLVVASHDHVVPAPARRVVRVTARRETMLGEVEVARAVAALLEPVPDPAESVLGGSRRNP